MGYQTPFGSKAPLASLTFSGTVQGVTKSIVRLGNVDNTADKDKTLSSDMQLAFRIELAMINAKANTASPTFSGTDNGIT